ncbi:unnamed protein product [Rhizophagus irregularis]|uniref:Uncharacterized protein n=1 Tax=Rhizophagus irregularis TaxID=588596 RepID=A0A915YQV9_9GLOM|nr:unnamed protein product [Rhizophagus irregularis]
MIEITSYHKSTFKSSSYDRNLEIENFSGIRSICAIERTRNYDDESYNIISRYPRNGRSRRASRDGRVCGTHCAYN